MLSGFACIVVNEKGLRIYMHSHCIFGSYHLEFLAATTWDFYLIRPLTVSQLLGGEQMTALQIRVSKRIARNGQCGTECLDGFVPVVEDFMQNVPLRGFLEMYVQSSPAHKIP